MNIVYLRTVNIEPPVTDEILLVEQSAIGTEEAVLDQRVAAVLGTDVEGLAVSVCVSVVPFYLVSAGKLGLGRSSEDGVVLTGNSGDILGWKYDRAFI